MIPKKASWPRFQLLYLVFVPFALMLPGRAAAQTPPEPDRRKLLNGLSILFWPRPGDANVLLKLRIHSGAAFDLAGKGGMMALLGDALFPDPATREYVTEQLGGRLNVSTNYDAIDVTISGKASEFERMIELFRSALVATPLTPENVARVRDARVKYLSEKPLTASEIADRAITARLLGGFPYGHPASGTAETVSKVDRSDLMLARERFLNADNATLVIIGGVEERRAMRALRQLLGPWGKSDRSVPATFRQPDPPDARVLVVNQPGTATAEIRLAVRGLARSDHDATAASLLAYIARELWHRETLELSSVSVHHDPHVLPGIFVMGASVPAASASKAVAAAQKVMRRLYQVKLSGNELQNWRSAEMSELSRQSLPPDPAEAIADTWLDIETFKLPPKSGQVSSPEDLTPADLQRVATRLFKDAAVATVVVGDYEQVKATFDRNVELRNERPEVRNTADPAKPAKKP